MTRILLCGDSYYDYDNRYPGLHWADNLPATVYRLARGGASNFSIWHQIQHSTYFDPDLVLISFTSVPRVEFPKTDAHSNVDLLQFDELEERMWHYRNTVYDNVDHALPGYNQDKLAKWLPYYIEEYEIVKNFIYIKSALDFLAENNVPYKYTLGEFAKYNKDFGIHTQHGVLPNGWQHPDKFLEPYFHIRDLAWHQNYVNIVTGLING